jgi:hypothetical protein
MSPDAYTAEAIQQAIAHGAITEAYQADPQQVIQESPTTRRAGGLRIPP